MKLEMLRKIMEKCTSESRVITVEMHHYNEPLLIPWIAEMIELVHSFGVDAFISSNLVNFKNGPAVMQAAPETFLISMSGWTQEIYERSHKDGDIEKVKDHMAVMSKLRKPQTHVQASWHKYNYNQHEAPIMEAYAKMLGFAFRPYTTVVLPHDLVMDSWKTGINPVEGEDCVVAPVDTKDACFDRRKWPCLIQSQTLYVNSDGDYSNCGNRVNDENQRGNLFQTTVKEIFQKRKTDPACLSCKAVGGHIYAQQHYARSKTSLVRVGEDIYRGLGLAGRFPKFSNWATHKFYMRGQEKETI